MSKIKYNIVKCAACNSNVDLKKTHKCPKCKTPIYDLRFMKSEELSDKVTLIIPVVSEGTELRIPGLTRGNFNLTTSKDYSYALNTNGNKLMSFPLQEASFSMNTEYLVNNDNILFWIEKEERK